VRVVLLVLSEVFAYRGQRVTDLLRAVGMVRDDWSGWYRVWEKPGRFKEERAGHILLGESLAQVGEGEPYVIGIDTTQVWRDSQTLEGRHPSGATLLKRELADPVERRILSSHPVALAGGLSRESGLEGPRGL
jgi:hypothetical protein